MGVHTFPKGICPKVNVIAQLEYELAYYDSAVHRFNHYIMRTPFSVWWGGKQNMKNLLIQVILNAILTQYTSPHSMDDISLPTEWLQGNMSIHEWALRSPVIGCQFTSVTQLVQNGWINSIYILYSKDSCWELFKSQRKSID